MACQSCRHQARRLARSLATTNELSSTSTSFSSSFASSTRRHFSQSAWRPAATPNIKVTPQRRQPAANTGKDAVTGEDAINSAAATAKMRSMANKLVAGPYLLNNQLEKLYKVCAAPAAYDISEELRKKDEVPRTAEGEELGTPEGPWLDAFNLTPSFSSWSHVTMLHMYLIFARLRCLDRETARTTQAQFVDNYFFDCERVMHLNHGMTSSALRQRYLKDIFMQWRGLIAAYDEAVAKGSDQVLAAAVWRNLFKAREDVDIRHLAAIVGWIRGTLRDLEHMEVDDMLAASESVFKRDPRAMLKLVDEPSLELKGLMSSIEGADGEVKQVEEAVKAAPGP